MKNLINQIEKLAKQQKNRYAHLIIEVRIKIEGKIDQLAQVSIIANGIKIKKYCIFWKKIENRRELIGVRIGNCQTKSLIDMPGKRRSLN